MKLNLGSGTDRRDGYVNVDIDPDLEPDVLADLNAPWPFDDQAVEEILMLDVLEHLDRRLHAIREAYRILQPGGVLRVRVPHKWSPDWSRDPSHRGPGFTLKTMRWIAQPSSYIRGWSFKLTNLTLQHPLTPSLKHWRVLRFGNISAVFTKV